MKNILLCSAALVGVAFAAAPAMAQVDVTVGGHTKNYVGYLSQDTVTTDERNIDMLRESEVHFNAEGTADNGLTYGFHAETEADHGDSFTVEESYLYLASGMGRVNLGSEDGANYLLQVAAPSADANVDGLRQYIQATNYDLNTANGTSYEAILNTDGLDYDNDATGQAEKVTYLSPNWSGFQFGVSYTPDVGQADQAALDGFATDDVADALGEAYEGALRYEGTFNNVGFAVGGGYTHVNVEDDTPGTSDDMTEWNIGADLDIGAFGLGAAYTQADNVIVSGAATDADQNTDTLVIGGDYTTGPFQFGISYLNQDGENLGAGGTEDVDTDRYTGGVVYTVTQGLTLRGSISYVNMDLDTLDDADSTSVLGGVQFNF